MTKDAAGTQPAWLIRLGITDLDTGQHQAHAAWNVLIAAGRSVLSTSADYRPAHLVFSGFLARAQGLHEGAVAAIKAENPYAAFTLLRAYAENAAAILYLTDKPDLLDQFWRPDNPVSIGKITNHAFQGRNPRFAGFKGIYAQLSEYVHPQSRSLLASSRAGSDGAIQWSSAPRFKTDGDAVMACAWAVELAYATAHLLVEYAEKFRLSEPDKPVGTT